MCSSNTACGSNFDQMNLILKVMNEFSTVPNSVVQETGLCLFFFFLKSTEVLSCQLYPALFSFLGFYFCGVLSQHSTNEVKKLGTETSSTSF